MSVIRVQNEGPDWRAQALVNFLGPLIGDAIKQQQQRDYNRKLNSGAAEVYRRLNEMNNPSPNLTAGQTATPSLTSTGNAWADALQQSGNSVLGQFDAGTAGIVPQAGAMPQQSPTFTREQAYQGILDVLANKRWGMLNPQDVQGIMEPYIKAAEQINKERERKALADAIMNAQDSTARNNLAWGAYLQGNMPVEGLDRSISEYRYENPYPEPYSFNTGEKTIYGNRNKRTGEYTQAGEFVNTLTPQQQADNNFRMNQLQTTDRQFRDKLAQDDKQFNQTLEFNREQANRSKYTYHTGDDGRIWKFDQFGNGEPVDPNSVALSNFEKQRIDALQNTRKALIDRRKQLQIDRGNELKNISGGVASGVEGSNQRSPELQRIDDDIAQIDGQIQEIDGQINSIFQSKEAPKQAAQSAQTSSQNAPRLGTGTDIGTNMLGNANKGTISSWYGDPRTRKDGTAYNHTGVDYPAAKGTPIMVPDAGTTLTVADVVNGNVGYGNYVDLEGNLNGHKIWFRIGHMDNNSIRVQKGQTVSAGDVIGGVGNTGNVRGKNGGYHMHLEAKIDGKRVDPTKFVDLTAPYIIREIPEEKRVEYVTNIAKKNPQLNPQLYTQADSPVVYRHPNGKTVTQSQFNELQRNGVRTPEQVRKMLEDEGYMPVQNTSTSGDIQVATEPNSQAVDNMAWRHKDGRAMKNNKGEKLTQEVYERMAQAADRGEYQEYGVNSRADLDAYIIKSGGVRVNPSEQNAVARLNGNRTTQSDTPDTNTAQLPRDPKTSPEKFQAPDFTDNINQTTTADTQALLDELNGVTSDDKGWALAFRRRFSPYSFA